MEEVDFFDVNESDNVAFFHVCKTCSERMCELLSVTYKLLALIAERLVHYVLGGLKLLRRL